MLAMSLSSATWAQDKSWPDLQSLEQLSPATGTVSQLTVIAQPDTAGATSVYSVNFVVNGDTLQPAANVLVFFPAGFGLNQIDSATFIDDDLNTENYSIDSVVVSGQQVRAKLSAYGIAPAMGSRITIKFYGITNNTLAGNYQVSLAILDKEGDLIAAPTWSSTFTIRAADLYLFDLFPHGIQQVHAGTTLLYYVVTQDKFGNAVTAQPIVWSVLGVPTQTGTIVDGSFQAKFTGASKIIATYQTFADTSSLVYVLPGVFAHFEFSGGPDSIIAGQHWANGTQDVTAIARDLFENVNYDYAGQVYFESTDPQALLPYTVASKYQFIPADQGRHVFPGSGFALYTAGRQDLRLVKADTVMGTIRAITVLPAAPATYNFSAPDTVVAGHSFTVSVSGAADTWGNAVSGQADINLATGNGAAPSGALPSLPSFFVGNGSGSGSVMLVKAGSASIQLHLGGVTSTKAVYARPDTLARFDFALDGTQTTGRPFIGTAQLTAYDQFDNKVDWFNAAQDTVTIHCSGSGSVINGRIVTAAAFVKGVCDLKTIGTGYSGTDFFAIFYATSQSGKQSNSQGVEFSFLKITGGNLTEPTRYVGDTFNFRLTISDFGSQPGMIDSLRLYVGGTRTTYSTLDRNLPDTIPALSNHVFTFTGVVPNRPNEALAIAAKFFGHAAGASVTDSVGNLATLTVLPLTGIGVTSSTLAPLQVTRDREYAFSVSVFNNSGDDLHLTTVTKLILPEAATYLLASPIVVAANGGTAQVDFVKAVVPDSSPSLISEISVELVGTLGSVTYDQVFPIAAIVVTQSAPSLTYNGGTLTPTTLFRGRNVAIALGVINSGQATLAVNVATAELSLLAGSRVVSTLVDTNQLSLASGGTNLRFRPVFVPADFPTTVDSITVDIAGTANGYDEVFHIKIQGNTVTIPGGAAVQLMGTEIIAHNAPYVDVDQAFLFHATVRNQGDEPLQHVSINLTSDGSSGFAGTINIELLPVEAESTVTFAVTASQTPQSSELFSAQIVSATGSNSGLAGQVLPGLNATQAVVIQSPALLRLVSTIASPPDAQIGTVGPSTAFAFGAVVLNNGQAGAGSGEVTLRQLKGSFTLPAQLTQTFAIDQNVTWNLTSPATPDTGIFEIAITSIPQDNNTGAGALVARSADTITVAVAEQQVVIGVDYSPAASTLYLTGATVNILSFAFDVVGASRNPYLKYIEFALRDRNDQEISPASVLSSAYLDYNGQYNLTAQPVGNHLRFTMQPTFGLPETAILQIIVRVDPSVFDAAIYLDSNSFAAEYATAGTPLPVPVIPRFASKLVIHQPFTLVQSSLEQSFFSYPNPFSPLTGKATFVYSPSADKPATLKIYTLTGEEVWSQSIPAPVSLNDPVTVEWDGRNKDNIVVLNGVYIAVLTVESAVELRTKVAVVK